MTAYTLAANATLRDISNASIWGVATNRTGGDTVDTNGFKLTIDQDSRYGFRGTTSTTWGNLTINASKGGEIHFDGRYVRLIPFTGGTGTITAGATVSISGATAKVIGLYSSMTSAPVLTGVADGWLKVTEWNQTDFPTSGALTVGGWSCVINGASAVGFIEVNGDDAGTINANRLGTFRVTGEWYELGTTSGAANQTVQVPTNGVGRYVPGVFIEQTAGLGDYEFYPTTAVTTAVGTEAARGKVVWSTSTGVVRIGHNGTTAQGYVPAAGLKIVIPNIFFECNTTAARTANVTPNTTLATRYDFTSTGGGVINIDKGSFGWYLSLTQPYSVSVTNSGFHDAIYLQEVASNIILTKVGVGAYSATVQTPLQILYCFAGGTITDCVFSRLTQAASGAHNSILTDITGFTFTRCTFRTDTLRGNATTYSVSGTRLNNCSFTNTRIVQGNLYLSTSNNITITDTQYVDVVQSTTITTYAMYVWNIVSSNYVTISGLTLPVTNTQPYTALCYIQGGSTNVKLRNIGTRASPLSIGSTNACANVIASAASGSSNTIKVQRVYVSDTRTGFFSIDNSNKNVIVENCAGDYADANDALAALELYIKGHGATFTASAQSGTYGTHWYSIFTSTTAGRLGLMMNEPTSNTSSYVTLTNGSAFTSAGGLYMPTVGMTATFETPYYVLGQTSFQNSALVMSGGTVGNYRFEYSIDKNDGNGYSTMTSSAYTAANLATALNGLTGIDASVGFKLKLQVSTTTGNTTAITGMYLLTNSSTTAQDYQYPLDTNNLTISNLVVGSDVVIRQAGTSTILGSVDNNATSSWVYNYSSYVNVDIDVIKPGYIPLPLVRNYSLPTSDATLICSQIVDRNYV